MRYNTAYKFRFYPTADQKAALAEVFGHTRYVWNWALTSARKATTKKANR